MDGQKDGENEGSFGSTKDIISKGIVATWKGQNGKPVGNLRSTYSPCLWTNTPFGNGSNSRLANVNKG